MNKDLENFNTIDYNFRAIEIIKDHKLLNYVLKNPKCAKAYNLSDKDIRILKEVIK